MQRDKIKPGADLSLHDFRGADLRGVDFSLCDLTFANFNGADLRGADLSLTRLVWASFIGAKVAGASFFGAEIRHTHGLELENGNA